MIAGVSVCPGFFFVFFFFLAVVDSFRFGWTMDDLQRGRIHKRFKAKTGLCAVPTNKRCRQNQKVCTDKLVAPALRAKIFKANKQINHRGFKRELSLSSAVGSVAAGRADVALELLVVRQRMV